MTPGFTIKWKEELPYTKGKKKLYKTIWLKQGQSKLVFEKRQQARQYLYNHSMIYDSCVKKDSIIIVHPDGTEERYIDSLQTLEEKQAILKDLLDHTLRG